jgi:hypothetical protein
MCRFLSKSPALVKAIRHLLTNVQIIITKLNKIRGLSDNKLKLLDYLQLSG